MLRTVLKGLAHYIDRMIPDREIAGLDMPAFLEGDLIENIHPTRPHILLDSSPSKALIVDVVWVNGQWCYHVLLNGAVWENVSASIVEHSWRLSRGTAVNDETEQSK
tara:strand:- start:164 stop:484 length:321 start_codon:yes stop_codon:yes gene_type:complete